MNRKGEIKYNKQGEKMTVINYRKYEDIDIQFEDGTIAYKKHYKNFKNGDIKHPLKNSIGYYIENELKLNLDNVWNWEKNNENGINPYETPKSSRTIIWLYCQEHDYHNYNREGNKVGYKVRCNNFYNGSKCGYCSTNRTHWRDSLAYKYPQIARMIAIKENGLTFEDCYSIAPFSHKKYYFKCLDCNLVSENKIVLQFIVRQGYSCNFCSDGISIPEKFMINILKQLNVDFQTQLNKSDFKWCGYFKYDFYIKKYNMIIEINGIQHYEECSLTKRNLFQEQMNDLFKYKCAKVHVDNYIVIDCRYSTLEWLKENITKKLSNLFNLSDINWELAWKKTQNSLCIKTWELWNNGEHDINKISNILDLNRSTVRSYLKQGVKCNKCDYTKEESKRIGNLKKKGKDNYCSRGVICITTGKLFYTITDACIFYNIKSPSGVTSCCKGKSKSAGKLEDGTKLIWKYINWRHNKIYKIKNNDLHLIK